MAVTYVTNGFVTDQLKAITGAPYITAIVTRTDLHASDVKKLVIVNHIINIIKGKVRTQKCSRDPS
jgi:hypothetical protein